MAAAASNGRSSGRQRLRRSRRLLAHLLQHHLHARRRHPRSRHALGAHQGPARLWRDDRQQEDRPHHRGRRDGHGRRAALRLHPRSAIRRPDKEKLSTQDASASSKMRCATVRSLARPRSTANANRLLEWAIGQAEDRMRKRKDKEVARQTATRKLRLPGKLADCSDRLRARHRTLHRRRRLGRRLGQAGARSRDAGRAARCAARSSTSPAPATRSCRATRNSPISPPRSAPAWPTASGSRICATSASSS